MIALTHKKPQGRQADPCPCRPDVAAGIRCAPPQFRNIRVVSIAKRHFYRKSTPLFHSVHVTFIRHSRVYPEVFWAKCGRESQPLQPVKKSGRAQQIKSFPLRVIPEVGLEA